MDGDLSADSFGRLLLILDENRDRAGEKYEALRRTLTRFFQWRGAPFPEEQTDKTLNRVARKLVGQVEIKNIGAYSYEVARLVCLEALKGKDSKRLSLDEETVKPSFDSSTREADDRESRLACLDACLEGLSHENRSLVLDYYRDDEDSSLINHRKALAKGLGLQREALANRVQRLRDKLQQCVTRCMTKKGSIRIP